MAEGKRPENRQYAVHDYSRPFKTTPYMPDKRIENVVKDLVKMGSELKEYLAWPEPLRENGPLDRVFTANVNKPA